MHISNDELGQLLIDYKVLENIELEKLLNDAQNTNISLRDLLISTNRFSNDKITELYANKIGWIYQKIDHNTIPKVALLQIPEHIARPYGIIVFKGGVGSRFKHVAVADPNNLKALEIIRSLFGDSAKIYLSSKEDILKAIELYRKVSSDLNDSLTAKVSLKNSFTIFDNEISDQSPAAQTLKLMLDRAVNLNATHIHIEPTLFETIIRYRIDGQLDEFNKLPFRTSKLLAARIKKLANMLSNESSMSQQGFFKHYFSNNSFTVHVATLPTIEGEKITLHIIPEELQPLSLQDLGIFGQALDFVNEAIIKPSGLILVTGPGKSGTTTTLRSLAWAIRSNNINISSIERSIEVKLNNITQLQINPKIGVTYPTSIKAFINNDSDVILVDEIKDRETAQLIIEAVLAGKLVLAGMSTNNINECINRLHTMGIEPHLLAYSLKAVINQRLIKKLIPEKSIRYTPTEKQLLKICQELTNGRKITTITPQLVSNLFAKVQHLNNQDQPSKPTFSRAINPKTSFKGRIGLFEILSINDETKQIIINQKKDMVDVLSRGNSMTSLEFDGLIKVLLSITTVDEVINALKN